MTIDDITKKLAHKIWELFDREEIHNHSAGNWAAAENIIRRIINGTYALDEFRNFFTDAEADFLRRAAEDYIARLKKDSDSD